ncbi:MAG: hypothetical protein U0269_26350 [Polyangiales bacterium]
MHYREGPGQRPIHTFEAVSDCARGAFVGALTMLMMSASVAMVGRIGGDIYCTRNQGERRCVLHTHYVGRTTVVRSTGGDSWNYATSEVPTPPPMTPGSIHVSSGDNATHTVYVPSNPLVFDARLFRESIDRPVQRGRWTNGDEAFRAASVHFFEFDSPGYFVRHRSTLAPFAVGACLSLAALSIALVAISTARRRRYHVRFDPNTDTAFVAQGTLFKLGPEREVKLSSTTEPTVRLAANGAELRSGEQLLLDAPTAVEFGLLDSLRRAIDRARTSVEPAVKPPSVAVAIIPASLVTILAVTLIGFVLRHVASVPSEEGSISLHSTRQCSFGGVTLLPGGSTQWNVRAGTHPLQLTSPQGQTVTVQAHVAPETTTHVECDDALFAQSGATR